MSYWTVLPRMESLQLNRHNTLIATSAGLFIAHRSSQDRSISSVKKTFIKSGY